MPKTSAIIVEQAQLATDPATPASGYSCIYPKSDGKWYAKNSSGVVTEITNVAGGGSDPWTYIKLSSDFTTSSATAVTITGMNWLPAANSTDYEFEAVLLVSTPTATVGPRAGLLWNIGFATWGGATIITPSSATAETVVHTNLAGGSSALAAVGGLPFANEVYMVKMFGAIRSAATVSQSLSLRMASETAGTLITVKAGSFLKWRAI